MPRSFLRASWVATEALASFVTFNPIGVVLAVMPWNFPFWQVFRFAAPVLMAGNAAVLKHASNVPGCALAVEAVFRESGFPEHLFRTVMISNRQVEAVIESPLVRAVTLTGSGPAGRAVASKAGAMLKKTALELGGSDPHLILEDADIDLAAAVSTEGRLVNSGQSCIAAKRFIVVDKVRRAFEERFLERMGAVKMGDPLDENTQIGPLARRDLRDTLHQQVRGSIAKGARLLLGGTVPNTPGSYYPPTVLTDVHKGMPAYEEELFGPVASIMSPRSSRRRTRCRRSRSPTTRCSGSAAVSSPATWLAASGSLPRGSKAARCSSMMRFVPILSCRSVASRRADMGASCRPTASRNSSTSSRWCSHSPFPVEIATSEQGLPAGGYRVASLR
jgi:succinate-semialdehyde dehydrogenase/glutarate-semialdehyde dehydrogenase